MAYEPLVIKKLKIEIKGNVVQIPLVEIQKSDFPTQEEASAGFKQFVLKTDLYGGLRNSKKKLALKKRHSDCYKELRNSSYMNQVFCWSFSDWFCRRMG